ncbi:26S proteasome non-ATPase regulatory subunit 4-like protein [Diplonema papillatum]|nr:26S proteasome non-ATPase regulatory subunit 4-like protein [Diplonema papillatum]KAJ9448974.1 26S proteasome non-ATPase regulatory subunit 4-like protein [Diplonema papillatum]
MTLEATYICIDNSESMRNGDFTPNRLQAVTNACHLLCGAKTQRNPENEVGFLTMADDRVRIEETLTSDLGRLLASLTNVRPGGALDLAKGLQVSQLGLKHRMNKTLRQRIVAFVGSKIRSSEAELVQLARRLKKYSVSVDVVSFGCDENNALLEKFVENVNSKQQDKDTSHLLILQPGQNIADALIASPIADPDGEGTESGDPELDMALRRSMEEERARQEKIAREKAEADGTAVPAAEGAAPAAAAASSQPMTEEEEIAHAMALSLQDAHDKPREPATAPAAAPAPMNVDSEELTEEQEMELALKMSLQETTDPEVDALMQDEDLTNEMAAQLGIDITKKDEKKDDKKDDK